MNTQEEERAVLAIGSAQRFFDTFCIAVDDRYRLSWHHELLARKLEDALEKIMRGEKVRIIIEMPPRHGKSEMATIKFPAWALGKYPELPIIVSSYGEDLAVGFGLQTRDLMNDAMYQSVFSTRLRADQKAKGKWWTTKKGGYTAAGIGGGITGKGFKIGIIDDPIKSREEADSETYREKIWNWYKGTFYTRQEGYGAIIVIATRWHKDDLIGRLIEKAEEDKNAGIENADEWDIFRFPAIAEEDEKFRKVGEPLWPWKYTKDMLMSIKNTVGLYEWFSQYQQTPIASEMQEFHKNWFRYYSPEDIKLKNLTYYTLVDPAPHNAESRKKSDPDNVVVRTIAKQKNEPFIYLIEETAGRLDPLQTIDAIIHHCTTYRSDVWIEGVAYQSTLEFWAKEEMKRRQVYFNVHILKRNSSVNKEMRVRGLIPMYKVGVIFHRANGDDAALEREALEFPKGKHDDRIDCLANMLEALENTEEDRKSRVHRQHQPMTEYGG